MRNDERKAGTAGEETTELESSLFFPPGETAASPGVVVTGNRAERLRIKLRADRIVQSTGRISRIVREHRNERALHRRHLPPPSASRTVRSQPLRRPVRLLGQVCEEGSQSGETRLPTDPTIAKQRREVFRQAEGW